MPSTASAQGLFPAAAPGDRTAALEPTFAQMEQYTLNNVIGTAGPSDEALASRIIAGLHDNFGNLAVNFQYQQDLVRLALLTSATASEDDRSSVNKILLNGLKDYWQRRQVSRIIPAYSAAEAIHFIELAQALVRVNTSGDASVTNIITDIGTLYAGLHPLSNTAQLGQFMTQTANGTQYVAFQNAILISQGWTAGTPGGQVSNLRSFWQCLNDCARINCDPGPVSQLGCKFICAPGCALEQIFG